MVREFFKIQGRRTKAQATLEMSLALILAAMLLVASAKIFAWLNGSMIRRQRLYEETRVSAGSQSSSTISDLQNTDISGGVMVNDSSYPTLNIFE